MGLANQHLNTRTGVLHYNTGPLALALKKGLPSVEFCLLMGSSVNGTVGENSDLDLAFYLSEAFTLDFYTKVTEIVEIILPSVCCDIGILNRAEPIFRFEALKGKLLFVRNQELYTAFFSLTCREYESQMFDYARQHRYRVEAATNAL